MSMLEHVLDELYEMDFAELSTIKTECEKRQQHILDIAGLNKQKRVFQL